MNIANYLKLVVWFIDSSSRCQSSRLDENVSKNVNYGGNSHNTSKEIEKKENKITTRGRKNFCCFL